MSIQITEDLVLGARYHCTAAGAKLLRVFDVSGLTPGRDTLAQAAVAVDAVSGARIPRYGDPHPAAPGLYAIDIEAEPLRASRTAARVKVMYAPPEFSAVPGAVRITIRGGEGRKLAGRTPDGALMTVKYGDATTGILTQHLQIPILSPNTILEITRQETSSPLRLSQRFRKTLNASPWQAGDAKTWLCRGIDASSVAGLSRYEVRYSFEYDPDGWTRLEYFTDPYTGKVPDDVQLSQSNDHGIVTILPYATMDFSQLGLPNAF